jgi:hypothetical protein
MFRSLFIAVPLVLTPLAASAPAPAAAVVAGSGSQSRTGEDCSAQRQTRRNRGRTIGGILGGAAGFLPGGAGSVASVATSILPVGELLGEAIASMLDCDEQQKAAAATNEVTEHAVAQAERGGDAVGTSATWESTTRPGVTGTSTVTAVNTASAAGDCMTVTDVVIVDGEETRADKQMCRRPPSNRYVRV